MRNRLRSSSERSVCSVNTSLLCTPRWWMVKLPKPLRAFSRASAWVASFHRRTSLTSTALM